MKRQRIESEEAGGRPVAAQDSYLDVFDDIASEKVDVIHAVSKKGCTLLMFAVRFGSLELVKKVINTPGFNNVNAQDAEKMTALHHAMRAMSDEDKEGRQKALTLLRDVPGIDVNVKCVKSITPVYYMSTLMSSDTDHELLDTMLAKGLDINATIDEYGRTLFSCEMESIRDYYPEHEKYMLDGVKRLLRVPNIDVNKHVRGVTAMSWAIYYRSDKLTSLLFEVATLDVNAEIVDVASEARKMPTLLALVEKWPEQARKLIAHPNFDANARYKDKLVIEHALHALESRPAAGDGEQVKGLERELRDMLLFYRGTCDVCTHTKQLLAFYPCGYQRCCKDCYAQIQGRVVVDGRELVKCPHCRGGVEKAEFTPKQLFRGGKCHACVCRHRRQEQRAAAKKA